MKTTNKQKQLTTKHTHNINRQKETQNEQATKTQQNNNTTTGKHKTRNHP